MVNLSPSIKDKQASPKRYRYFEVAPERITVPVQELLDLLPGEFRHEGFFIEQDKKTIALPCADLLCKNTPRLRVALLQELLPGAVRIPEGMNQEHTLPLPAGWLALHYKLETRSEELPPEPGSEPEPEKIIAAKPLAELVEIGEECVPGGAMPLVSVDEKNEAKTEEGSEIAEKVDGGAPAGSVDPLPYEKKHGFFASLPIFRRHEKPKLETAFEQAVPVTPAWEPLPAAFEPHEPLPVSKVEAPEGDKNSEIQEIKEINEVDQPDVVTQLASALNEHKYDEQPVEQKAEEKPLTLERLWKLDPSDHLADPSALQSLFMTEEKLTLERVIVLAGQLPGLKACVLAHGDQVACASNAPAGIDLPALSKQATIMLTQIRDSSAQMGLGAVPAITLHAEQGILSFLYHGELCLLVLHAERGFVPGVRERLAEMLAHLSSAKPLQGGASPQPSLPI